VSWGNPGAEKGSSDNENIRSISLSGRGRPPAAILLISKDEAMVFDPSRNY